MVVKHLNKWMVGMLLAVLSVPAYSEEADPFEGRLLPLELVMSFRKEISLSDAQNKKIGQLVVAVQQAVATQQWQLQSAYFDLQDALDAPSIDEAKALSLVRAAVDAENEIKLEQVKLLIRLRNLLDQQQIAYLRQKVAEGWSK